MKQGGYRKSYIKQSRQFNLYIMESPLKMYQRIESIESDMEKNIHDIVWQYGTKSVTKKYGTRYSLSTYWLGRYATIIGRSGEKYKIKKVFISNPEECQRMGYLFLVDDNGSTWSLSEFYHQHFNIYAPLYNKTIDKPVKNKIEKK